MANDLKQRTKVFALNVIGLYGALPGAVAAQVIGKQLLRAGTSIGAQYREAHRSRSDAEFISKLEATLQELDETTYWLELLHEICLDQRDEITSLLREADELTAIFVTSVKTVKARKH